MSDDNGEPKKPEILSAIRITEFVDGTKQIEIAASGRLHAAALMGFFITRLHNDQYAADKKAAEEASASRIERPHIVVPPGLIKQ